MAVAMGACIGLALSVVVCAPALGEESTIEIIRVEATSGDSTASYRLDAPMSRSAAEAAVTGMVGPATFTVDTNALTAVPQEDHSSVEVTKVPSGYRGTDEDEDGTGSTMALAPEYFQVYCDEFYSFRDENAQFTIQRGCGLNRAPWSIRLAEDVQAICVTGTVNEAGLKWTLNGVSKPQQAPHAGVTCGYIFHGRFSGVSRGDGVTYTDTIKFRHNLGPGGTATVTVYGKLRFRGRTTTYP